MLFADLKGSMELLADRDPEDARTLLDPVLQHMMEAVHRYEGTVNQVMGDGIMALFGAPLAHEDHAVRACYAALRCRNRRSDTPRTCAVSRVSPSALRVGLNSGEVVVRAIGSDLRTGLHGCRTRPRIWPPGWSSSPIPGSILLTPDTLKLAEGLHAGDSASAPMAVKGLSAPDRGL